MRTNRLHPDQRLRSRNKNIDSGSGDYAVGRAGMELIRQARFLDQNYDMVIALFDDLTDKIVGTGITSKPRAKRQNGEPCHEFNHALKKLYVRWSLHSDVTGELSNAQAQRLECRTWLRDGEIFIHLLTKKLHSHSPVPFAVEHLEADLCPLDLSHPLAGNKRIVQGVEKNGWGKPIAYHFYHQHPGDPYIGYRHDYVRVNANKVLHLKLFDRAKQTRGVTLIHGVMGRIQDLKEYDESEIVAARINAAMGFQVLRDVGMDDAARF